MNWVRLVFAGFSERVFKLFELFFGIFGVFGELLVFLLEKGFFVIKLFDFISEGREVLFDFFILLVQFGKLERLLALNRGKITLAEFSWNKGFLDTVCFEVWSNGDLWSIS
jgi:hypothetical protein